MSVNPLSVVVIPARDEQDRVGACLAAVAAQSIGTDGFEVLLVADACSDRTEEVAVTTALALGIELTILQGPGQGTGPARRLGMDAAATRLESLGHPDGLIATTDADSQPAPDWLERQLAHLNAGARVIAGNIVLEDEPGAPLGGRALVRRQADAARRLTMVHRIDPSACHHHFAGASLGISAATYRGVGGIEATPALEDEFFAQRLASHGVAILRPDDVVVRTAARVQGRAHRGLSVDLAVSRWRDRRRYEVDDFATIDGRERGVGDVTVVVPTKNCAATIGDVLRRTVDPARNMGLVQEVVVIDADSADGTASVAERAGARVIQQDEVLQEIGPALGKGDAMWRALSATDGDIVCFLDGDTADPDPNHLVGLLGPLLREPDVQVVKAAFDRPLQTDSELLEHEGGRVTELTARPLLNLHFPLLAGFAQPLAGEFAVRRPLLEQLSFPVGYGVEIAVLIDALGICGLDALAECRVGRRQNRHQPLRALSEMAFAVLAAVERRIDRQAAATAGQYLLPWDDGASVQVPVLEREPLNRYRRKATASG